MKSVSVEIKGISPLLMHRYPMEPIESLEKKPPAEQAKLALYEQDGKPYIPGEAMVRCLVNAAGFSKGKGRASLAKNAAAGMFVEEPYLWLNGVSYKVDGRPVVVPATRGRVMRYRPRFDSWGASFTLSYDENLISEVQARRVVDDAGARVGLLDYRPEKKGPMGRFSVTHWEPVTLER